MSQISKCPKLTVLLTYWEALGDVLELSYKSLLYCISVGSVGHKGEFPDGLRGNISGLIRLIEVTEGRSERADFSPEQQI